MNSSQYSLSDGSEFFSPTSLRGSEMFSLPGSQEESRRSSFRLSISSLRKILLIAPLSRHKCCLGCVSLRDAVPLICVIEIIFIALSSMFALDFYVNNGVLFFTHELEGKGHDIAVVFGIFLLLSLFVVLLTLLAWYFRKRHLYVAHATWQLSVVSIIFYFVYHLLLRIFIYRQDTQKRIMIPSAITIAVFVSFIGMLQLWWLFIIVDALLYEDKDVDVRGYHDNDYNDTDNYSVSKHNIPILVLNDGEDCSV